MKVRKRGDKVLLLGETKKGGGGEDEVYAKQLCLLHFAPTPPPPPPRTLTLPHTDTKRYVSGKYNETKRSPPPIGKLLEDTVLEQFYNLEEICP